MMTAGPSGPPGSDVAPVGHARSMTDLTPHETAILDFEREWWRYAGAKGYGIREVVGVSEAVYYRRLNELLDDPRAMAYDRMLVKRLRRMRAYK